MTFDNLKFYFKDPTTGELTVKFLCDDCRKEMDKPHYLYQVVRGGKDFGYHFLCHDCYEIRKEYGDTFTSIKEHLEIQKENNI